MVDPVAFSARFKKRRYELGLTLQQIAAEVGLAWQSVGGWEHGSVPRPARFEKIARVMGMSVEELFYGRAPTNKELAGNTTPTHLSALQTRHPVPIIGLRDHVPVIPWSLVGNWKQHYRSFHPGDAERWINVTGKFSEMAFAVRATGDAMASATDRRNLPDGAYVVFDPAVPPAHDRIVLAVLPDGHALIRVYWLEGDRLTLKPLNDRYPIADLPEGSQIVGVAVQALKDL